ncbi:MAG: hypothetical protein ACTSO7_10495 [Candidatus Heimdallarchaeota archaeon]
MRKNGISILIILVIILGSTVAIVKPNLVEAYFGIAPIDLVYDDFFTDRFTNDPIDDVSFSFYVHTCDINYNIVVYFLGSATTNENGWIHIEGTVDMLCMINDYYTIPVYYATFIELTEDDYISEYYQYDDNGNVKLNHEQYGWTIEYQCDYYGYVKRDLFPYPPISGATIEIWGVDDHLEHFLCESTTTNSQGYFNLECNFETPYPNPLHVVAEYYYFKVIKFGYVPETVTSLLYPYPNGAISLGTIYMWGLSRW